MLNVRYINSTSILHLNTFEGGESGTIVSEDYGIFNLTRQYTDKSGTIHKKHNGMFNMHCSCTVFVLTV
jgi:hypothetical protein